ncbi:MAG: hypothetical protein GC136_07335 [Alphaproteobacteria bacterium]|nr:hypothetical protein [Alphaproteobacteria bacterium]
MSIAAHQLKDLFHDTAIERRAVQTLSDYGQQARLLALHSVERVKNGAFLLAPRPQGEFTALAAGYNSLPKGMAPNPSIYDEENRELKLSLTRYAIESALDVATREGIKTAGAEILTRLYPAARDAYMMGEMGIRKVYVDRAGFNVEGLLDRWKGDFDVAKKIIDYYGIEVVPLLVPLVANPQARFIEPEKNPYSGFALV